MSNTVVSLAKGGVVNLSKHTPGLTNLTVGLGWTPASENNVGQSADTGKKKGFLSKLFGGDDSDSRPTPSGEYDLDAFVLLLQDGVYVHESDSTIYYGHKDHSTGCVHHHGDNLVGGGNGDDEQISIKLDAVPAKYNKLVIAVNIYRGIEKHQSFGDITKAFIRLVNNKDNQEMCRYDISKDSDYKGKTAMVLGFLKRVNGEWEFKASGDAYRVHSIADLADKF